MEPKTKKSLFIILAGCLLLSICLICSTISIFLILKNNNNSSNTQTVDNYLGYEEFKISITNNTEYNQEVYNINQNFISLAQYEEYLLQAVANEDIDSYFSYYQQYNNIAFKIIAQAQALYDYTSGENSQGMLLINSVYAKERSSWWYIVPVIGSLIKGRHQSIETARSGVYNYMKNDLAEVDRNEFLTEYGLDSIEDLKNADDATIEKLSKDPELRGGINWTKMAVDVGEQAVYATVEGCQIATHYNPLGATAIKGGIRMFTKKGKAIEDPFKDETRATIAISNEVREEIDNIIGNEFGNSWQEVSIRNQDRIAEAISGSTSLITSNNSSGIENISLPTGEWTIFTTTAKTVPIELNEVEIKKGQTANIEIEYLETQKYQLDPAIAMNLGFTPEYVEIEPTSCSDYLSLEKNKSTGAINCQNAFKNCQKNPITYKSEYYTCISTGGGCWDIGRWEYINDNNCPIDKDNNLDYSDPRLQDDYEYFGGGNRVYCECIVKCRQQYVEHKDCNADLMSCCENL